MQGVEGIDRSMSNSLAPLDFTSLEGALTSLRRALLRSAGTPMDEELRDACIQRFEYTFELAWKMLKRQMEREALNSAEIDGYSFKQLFRVAGEKGLIVDVPAWFDFREKRNLTAHTYDARKAAEVYAVIAGFEREVTDLLARLQARRGE